MNNPLVRIDPGLLIWTLITFVVLLLLLGWKAWGPIVGAIERREKLIKDAIETARKDREEALRLLGENKRMIDQARKETAAMIEQGRQDAEGVRAELIDKAKREASGFVEAGRMQIERETRSAVQELRKEAANLAVLAAGRIVKASLDEAAQKRLVEECLREIADHPGH